jgi:hypothetical protein
MRDRPKSRLGHGLAASPAGQTACAARCNTRVPVWSPRADRAWGVARWRARRWLDDEHRWGPGEAPGKKSGDRAHRDGRTTVGRREAADAAVFNGGEVAPVVVDVRGGVLQHRCGRGKRDVAPIWERRSSEGAHRRGGRQWWRSAKSDMRERPPVAGGDGTGAEMVGREVALERGAGAGSVTREWTKDLVTFERLG